MAATKGLSASKRFVRTRLRTGLVRSRNSLVPAIQMTVCAVGAYAFAEYVLGHQGPLFAATSSLIALGFSRDPRLRRVIEVGLGCTLGIVVGDLLLHWLGAGIWQAAVVLLFSILLARFLDSGTIFTTQLGLQSLLVVLLPAPAGGPFTRSLDAVVGGLFALLVTVLMPKDPRREPRKDIRKILDELAEILRDCAKAMIDSDSTAAWHALIRGRNCQALVDRMRQTLRASGEVATLAPAHRRHRDELAGLEHSLEYIDLALRNSRVFARRLTSAINHAALSDEAIDNIAEVLQETAAAIDELTLGLAEQNDGARRAHMRRARTELTMVASRVHPKMLDVQRLEGEAVVMLFRPLLVDLLEASGLDPEEARSVLPRL
ncbi:MULTISPECIES: aromatic acid exporter family protein [Paenarthrobacter]|uniref:FUSC family protein n=1 Tax=Paenarthrobacter ureafaciens TaxID=37931 RepID=A0AAX3EL95_PAEUR|nr:MULTISPECIES: FUSC family protein [Paenarthrobacter]NKR13018.1 fusaric acid resistance protein [Arthrobacter sp. M5]NKR16775.1 fusaric acid resistance protein [Arthrobacter sp. M6]OEH59836.1 fusaric acid resistance protein [Arthrobacter sp. D4]OEH60018.1 fusaric acid resistance protein [Arthrobacter sp. D2]MDO5862809.1 FUSC family protein [Paenarthrobacter sp. SD-2]